MPEYHLTTQIKKAVFDAAGMEYDNAAFASARSAKRGDTRKVTLDVNQPLNRMAYNDERDLTNEKRERCCDLIRRRVRAWYKAKGKVVPKVSVFCFYTVQVYIYE